MIGSELHKRRGAPDIVEAAVYAGVFLLPLACWPDIAQSFSTPKLWVLCGIAAAVGACVLLRRPARRPVMEPAWPWLVWLAALGLSAAIAPFVSFEALLIAMLPLAPAFALREGWLSGACVERALVWGSAIQSAVVALEFLNLDLLRWFGWQADTYSSSRMRVYGLMGNPDFVAAWLCATLPLAVARATRRPRLGGPLLALQAAAILATGSRAAVLALPVMAAVYAFSGSHARKWWLAAVPLAALALWLSPGRSLQTTIEGRLYLARIAASHCREIPIAGYGPGSFEFPFAAWQTEWLRTHGSPPSAARFAGLVDHAHNDYLEFLIEYGPVGLCAFLALSGWLIGTAARGRRGFAACAPAWAGLAGLLAVACVDFPFHRPAEWCLYWLLLAMPGTVCGASQEMNRENCRSTEKENAECQALSSDGCAWRR